MPIDVTAFSALARAEFMQGKIAAEQVGPAEYTDFVTRMPSTVRVETHTYMSNLPRLRPFTGYSPGHYLTNKEYLVTNMEYRIGPVKVKKTDLDDDQIGGYLQSIQALPTHGQRDIGFTILKHLAAGDSTACFDTTNFFADSHLVGSGDNSQTYDCASNDGITHRLIFLNTSNPTIKPIIFQDRESLSSLLTDADTPQALKQKEFEYWADTRFGLGYGYWWDGVKVTITDTPTLTELWDIIRLAITAFRSFTLPPGDPQDKLLYVHEGWMPSPSTLTILCNIDTTIAELLRTVMESETIAAGTGGGVVTNVFRNYAKVVPTSALNS